MNDSRVFGELICTPALDQETLSLHGWAAVESGDLIAEVQGDPETVGLLPDGSIGVIPGTQRHVFRCRHYDLHSISANDLHHAIETLANEAEAAGAKVSGIVNVRGDGAWRFLVVDNKVQIEHPDFIWPDGSREEPW